MMNQPLYIGVDGGASKCIVRVENAAGQLLGEEVSGPANIRLSVTQSWQSIFTALKKIGIPISEPGYELHVGVGIAGSEIREAYQAFVNYSHPFKKLKVTSDAHTACLGAHGGGDGAVIIAGTGVVGYQIQQGKITQVGGFGFPYDDAGSGAWIGLEAVRRTLRVLDGRGVRSPMTAIIASRFNEDCVSLANWANSATSTDYATLAPIVIQQSEQGDVAATDILKQAAHELDIVWQALQKSQLPGDSQLSCALVGGVAPYLKPHLGAVLQSHLCALQGSPTQGAIFLARAAHE